MTSYLNTDPIITTWELDDIEVEFLLELLRGTAKNTHLHEQQRERAKELADDLQSSHDTEKMLYRAEQRPSVKFEKTQPLVVFSTSTAK